MTHKRYIDQPLTVTFTAQVLEAHIHDANSARVILDETYFYPTGGGQAHDRGTLNGQDVLDVYQEAGQVVHVIAGEPPQEQVDGVIDWTYRLRTASAHTAQHILSASALQVLDADTLAVKMNAYGASTVDIDRAQLTPDQIDAVQALTNQMIQDNRAVLSHIVPSDSSRLIDLRRPVKTDKVYGDVRLVEIADFDLSACAGAHVPHTGMIGLLKILKSENYKGGSRLHFVVGQEALTHYNLTHQVLETVSNMLSCGVEQVPELVEKLQAERATFARQVSEQAQALLAHDAQALLQKTSHPHLILTDGERSPDDLRTLAHHLLADSAVQVVVFLQLNDDAITLIVASDEANTYDANALLQAILTPFGGRGGGRTNYAQGVIKAYDDLSTIYATVKAQLPDSVSLMRAGQNWLMR
ncbi:MAG: alanyl-tRNA editing protein [Anaerolineae bacterium]